MEFIKFLKTNENSRKIFGVREIKIIEKQLLGLNLTQSEKNRLSRDIRKKLKFIKEIQKFETRFELKKSKINKELIDETIKIIKKNPKFHRIKKIILFGSTIENKRTFRSDIDIAVEFDKITLKEATQFRISSRVPETIDLQVLNTLPEKIKKSIEKKYRVLYQR